MTDMDEQGFTYHDALVLRFGKPKLQLSGEDGNGFLIASRARKALHNAGYPMDAEEKFFEEALSGDYDHLLQVVMKWCDVS